jgi:thioredoxin-related protein
MNTAKLIFTATFLFLIAFLGKAQNINDSINWMTFDEVRKEFSEVQKPVMIFLYSQKSDSSVLMQKNTFSNPEVANYINILFYPLKLDVYSEEALTFFDGRVFENTESSGNKHDLAFMLAGRNDTLPALVFFDVNAQGQTFYGYKNRDEIFRTLIYYAENIGTTTSYEDWEKYHTRAFPPGQEQVMTRLNVRWLPLDEAMQKHEKHPQKILLNFYDYRKVSCTVMRTQVFNDKRISDYINQHYYPINIDVFTTDTLEIFGKQYVNSGEAHNFHQLPIAALAGYMKFPAFIIIDEENNVREKFQDFYTVEALKPILEYYGSDAYKKENWKDYLKLYEKREAEKKKVESPPE